MQLVPGLVSVLNWQGSWCWWCKPERWQRARKYAPCTRSVFDTSLLLLLSINFSPALLSSRLTERERHRQRMTRRGGARKGAPLQRARAGAHRLSVQLATASSQIENTVGGHGIPGLGARAKSKKQDKTEKGAEEKKGVGEQICYIRSL